jgi:hypothetical protein
MNKSILYLLSALLVAPAALWAVRTEKWENDSFAEFCEGEAHGVIITSDGYLRIGPEARKLVPLPVEVVWAVAPSKTVKGESSPFPLYVAAGNEGQVFKVEADGKVTEFFKAAELQVQALAVDAAGNLYAGSVPDGKIYRIDPSGKSSVFFEPKEKYIWAFAFDADENLFAATGEKGKLFKVKRSGSGAIFYDSDETHLRSLLFDREGRLWAGSDGNGLVYRFDSVKGATGTPFVAYDSDHREVKALVAASDGSIFVGALGNGKSSAASSSVSKASAAKSASAAMSLTGTKTADDSAKTAASAPAPEKGKKSKNKPTAEEIAVTNASVSILSIEIPAADEFSTTEPSGPKVDQSEVVRISPDGSVEKWWVGSDELYSLIIPEPGKVWVGTGSKGRLFELTAPRRFSVLGQIEAKTVTALLPNGSGKWLAASSNSGAFWTLTAAPGRKGEYESRVFDARTSSAWGAVQCTQVPGEGRLTIATRSGNTSKPDKVWGDWTALDEKGRIRSPTARYLQYRVTLEWPGRAEQRPLLVDRVGLFYQPYNLPPQVTRINILAPNMEIVKMPRPEMPATMIPPPSVAAPGKNSSAGGGGDDAMMAMLRAPMMQQVRHLGWRSATWQSSDPNSDKLRYDVFYRPGGSDAWKPLKQNFEDQFISWDAATWPDGDYYLKIVASDLPSNPDKEARTGELTSDLFTVDNTAPTIQADASASAIQKGGITFTITDTTSIVDEAEVAVDGGEWRPILPVGGLFDSKSNPFVVPVDKLAPGDHYIVIRASDSANNVATQTVRFKK